MEALYIFLEYQTFSSDSIIIYVYDRLAAWYILYYQKTSYNYMRNQITAWNLNLRKWENIFSLNIIPYVRYQIDNETTVVYCRAKSSNCLLFPKQLLPFWLYRVEYQAQIRLWSQHDHAIGEQWQ